MRIPSTGWKDYLTMSSKMFIFSSNKDKAKWRIVSSSTVTLENVCTKLTICESVITRAVQYVHNSVTRPPPPPLLPLTTNNTCGRVQVPSSRQFRPDWASYPVSYWCLLVSGGRWKWNIFYFPAKLFSDELVDRGPRPVSYPGHLQCPQLGGERGPPHTTDRWDHGSGHQHI